MRDSTAQFDVFIDGVDRNSSRERNVVLLRLGKLANGVWIQPKSQDSKRSQQHQGCGSTNLESPCAVVSSSFLSPHSFTIIAHDRLANLRILPHSDSNPNSSLFLARITARPWRSTCNKVLLCLYTYVPGIRCSWKHAKDRRCTENRVPRLHTSFDTSIDRLQWKLARSFSAQNTQITEEEAQLIFVWHT